jgi:RNA polymerase sigma-70 factor (ECF subfamily)
MPQPRVISGSASRSEETAIHPPAARAPAPGVVAQQAVPEAAHECETGGREHGLALPGGDHAAPEADRMQVAGEPGPIAASSTDGELIERARRGEHDAYADLVRRYGMIAHRTAVLIAGPADAEDAVQEAFIRAFYALSRFRRESPFKPWLLAIVANAARNKRRSSGQQPRLADRLSDDRALRPAHAVPSAESAALDADERRSLANAVDRLPSKARLVVTCRYLLELSEAETAQVLGWPLGTVKSRLSRALDALRTSLAESATEVRER